MTEYSLTAEHLFKAPPKAVFDAWLDPEMLKKFMLPGDGMTVPEASSDAKTGGRFNILMKSGEHEMPHTGTYREISPYDRLVFTWESPFSSDGSEVELTFVPEGNGTRLTLTHTQFLDEEQRDNHKSGWENILVALDNNLAA